MSILTRPRVAVPALLLTALALALAAWVTLRGGPDDAPSGGQRLSLALPDGLSAASCLPFSVETLRGMSPAFAGTVTSADGNQVVLTVDRWYAGPGGDQVVLSTPSGTTSAALDGVEFRPGGRYLVTAAGGAVNTCGYSGESTPELQAAFEQAFPG